MRTPSAKVATEIVSDASVFDAEETTFQTPHHRHRTPLPQSTRLVPETQQAQSVSDHLW